MKNSITSNWSFARMIRVILGAIVGIQGIMLQEYLLSGLGFLIAVLAIAGINTCAGNACGTHHVSRYRGQGFSNKKLDYEELDHSK